jgi:hypothetical protein
VIAASLSAAFVVVSLANLRFGRWIVRQSGDPKSLRDAAAFIRATSSPPWAVLTGGRVARRSSTPARGWRVVLNQRDEER